MSTIEVNKITPVSGGTTVQVGESGDTINIPAGATIANAGTATGFGVSLANGADNRVVTASSASALNGEANLTYSSPDLTVTGGNPSIIHNNTTSGGDTGIKFQGSGVDYGFVNLDNSNGALDLGTIVGWDTRFYTNNTERMRLKSNGYLGVTGTAGTGIERRLSVYGSHVSEDGLVWIQTSNGSGDTNLMLFFDGNTNNCGEITLNANANTVAYVTSSDYRLKQNATDIADGITRLKQLKPYRFQWKSDPDNTVDGFFAHEAQEVVPESVKGTKDAMKTAENVVVNSDGTVECYNISQADWEQGKIDSKYANNSTWEATKEVIDRQGIDQAKLVPLLTAALKEAITKIETLEAKVAALESA
jgi:hypothetical protein